MKDYPFHESIDSYAILYHDEGFILFGGWSKPNMVKTVAKLTINDEWIRLGELKEARQGHSVIFAQGAFLVVGGFADFYNISFLTENCHLDIGDSITCVTQNPQLELYGFYPELFLVSANYCKTIS